jgi:hypothetical protein
MTVHVAQQLGDPPGSRASTVQRQIFFATFGPHRFVQTRRKGAQAPYSRIRLPKTSIHDLP